MTSFRTNPGGCLCGEARVPGDKSISHRAVMLTAIAEGSSRIHGLLTGTDVLATAAAFRAMGVSMEFEPDGALAVQGVGRRGLRAPQGDLDLGNSGTAMRLMAGLLSGQRFPTRLVGDASLSRRPMRRVTEPLRQMGADIEASSDGTPPLVIRPVNKLSAIRYRMPVASAQVKSAILLAGLYADGRVCVAEPAPLRDHTERMLQGMGVVVEIEDGWRCIEPGDLRAVDIQVPADFSSAAFFLVGASIAPGSELRLSHVGVNPTRTGLLQVLLQMGADIRLENQTEVAGEPVADLVVRSSSLRGIEVAPELVPLAIDEFPIICVAAALAEGETRIREAEELRHKESDRISAMAAGLRTLGVEVEEAHDGMTIQGRQTLNGGAVDSFTDHRIAMAFAIAGLRASASITVRDVENVATSFPGFESTARALGLELNRDE
ncbi:MAG TPA: 3-phosphoshikimate 1-carboxyvinyltransferase [Arenicellales bacterium]|nr:3-phosphoshikimate 1-carboxyvinyltransferase [Arenicellales bacterium]